ncbi:hypothetical protein, partial [Pseudomonas gregormendelii]|uniref:hypothetical protein n=1 Tax=Pseudomonas gregormendelii TaxID=1628277 RepID=UPI001982342D
RLRHSCAGKIGSGLIATDEEIGSIASGDQMVALNVGFMERIRLKQHRLALSSFFRDKFQPHQLVEIDLSDQTNQQLPKG